MQDDLHDIDRENRDPALAAGDKRPANRHKISGLVPGEIEPLMLRGVLNKEADILPFQRGSSRC
jgi:hypothetical protein